MTYSYFLILLIRKQSQKVGLVSKVEQLEWGSMYRFPDLILQTSATKQVVPFTAWTLTFHIAFSTHWLSWAAPIRLVCRLSEKARRKRWKISHHLLEGLFSSVGPDVVVEGGGPSKGTATVAALERPVAGVSDHVVPQFWRLGEGLGAVAALVRSETSKQQTNRLPGHYFPCGSMDVSNVKQRPPLSGDIFCFA